jgi:transposase
MGAPRKADWREERRKQAWNLKQQGWKHKKIAKALGVSEGAVSQWMKRGREGGQEALRTRPPRGAQARLTPEQLRQLPALLAKGAESYGFRGNVWTARRVAKVIEQMFGVRYSRDHVSYLLRKLGLSRQKPEEQATGRDEEAIQAWRDEHWPALKKS